ncbi:hypothetical protein SAMN04487905_10667 [Actinopolyspora xinjiangensis]|uniref:Tetratricopeptide repeat-containing protein n=1 Tax=Actinopolyspora xinjiangensis TaxID=405564 RepID=A0A1H0U5D0_9ACTN|nr:hypothetical protein [Actinopolyspora xinjiangensis]SDP61487.1 hypothetical protein SAMN04487905_10667 [Actinopolyspora xinjiangensis]
MARERGSRTSNPGHELVDSAWQLRWRVPELALLLANRATAYARRTGDTEQRLQAEAIALFAGNRLGRSVAGTERALGAFRDAERAGASDPLESIRVELACCARGSGSPEAALRVLHPLLELERVPARLRAHALIELCGALPMHRRAAERVEALDEADRLYAAESTEDQDTTQLLRARVASVRAAHYRGNGEFAPAIEAAASGLDFLERLGDPAADGGEIRAGLVLEQVQSLLDLGKQEEALRCSTDVLRQPLRAAAAAPVGWLRLALATRVHLPAGHQRTALESLTEALSGARRHELFDLQAALLNTLSQLHEKASDLPEALRCVRDAYSADHHWRRTVERARLRLSEEFPAPNSAIPSQQSGGNVSAHGAEQASASRRASAADAGPVPEGPDARQEARRLMNDLLAGGTAPRTPYSETVRHRHAQDSADTREPSEAPHGDRSSLTSGGTPHRSAPPYPAEATSGRRHRAPERNEEGLPNSVGPDELRELAASGGDTRSARRAEPEPQPSFPGVDADETSTAVDFPAGTEAETDFGWPVTERTVDSSPGTGTDFPSSTRSEDVTTIMPVVPSAPSSGSSGERAEEPPAGLQAWPETDPPSGDVAEPSEPGGFPASGPSTVGHTAEPAHPWEGSSEPGTDGTSLLSRPVEPTETEEPPARRSRGRSLAEIRAALEAEGRGTSRPRRSRSAEGTGTTPGAGGRRRRAEPAEPEEPVGSEERAESVGGTGTAHPAVAPDEGEADPPGDAVRQPAAVPEHLLEQSRELIRDFSEMNSSGGENSGQGQAGLADLLAEALVAYRSGRRGEDPAGTESSPTSSERSFGRSEVSGDVSGREPGTVPRADREPRWPGGEEPSSREETAARTGTDDTPSRAGRRHAAGETETGSSHSWTPHVR